MRFWLAGFVAATGHVAGGFRSAADHMVPVHQMTVIGGLAPADEQADVGLDAVVLTSVEGPVGLTYVEGLALAWHVVHVGVGAEVVAPVDQLAADGGLDVVLVAMA